MDCEDAPGMPHQADAGGREFVVAPASAEQPNTGLILQAPHLLAHGGLRPPDQAAGMLEGACFRDCHKGAKCTKIEVSHKQNAYDSEVNISSRL